MINPDDYVITRRRKRYKFAKFANSPLCFEFDEWKKRAVDVIEIGAGTALFSVEPASKYPDKEFVAIDVKADRLQKGAYLASERELTNITFLRARADQLDDCFIKNSVGTIWITFPDPYPKKRSAGRRLTHPTFLKRYKALLRPSGTLNLKHDSPEFFTWSLEQLVAEKWQLTQLSFDLHDSLLETDGKIITTYERRWQASGRLTHFVSAQA